MGILVIGSFMMDLVVRTGRFPQNGETVIGSNFSKFPGGKGANQAVAAARLGADVTMAGKVGSDPFGDEFIVTLKNEGINTENILCDSKYPTGVGSITLEESGNNRIVVVPGANLHYDLQELNRIKGLIQNAELLIVQLEMDLSMIEQAVAYASGVQVPVILNPAPAQKLSERLLEKVTYLTPNETEVEILTGIKILTLEDAEIAGKVLLDKGVQNVVITLAEKGSLIVNKNDIIHIPSYKVQPVDTVAAGDAFNGALAVGIVNKKPLQEAVEFANAVGALAVTREGAIPSLPNKAEVENFLIHQNGNQ
ncbi:MULTISPECIES: ribokinase [unclassified Cytobacillus]|uniref:ribokinase n=1 Tax=unclassified Cytobacillus TaxID=2675268 RepID=UPI001358D476|nr:ribokinase [Cytobacillus sp. AMY 15.2]KAF0817525.1 Ribokinase [Bacillus sp. ZZV12-4809]MCM3089699.1 ribokinase [Cytobacillus sp. AMY 15.2]